MKTNNLNKHKAPPLKPYKPMADRSFRVILITLFCFFLGFGLCLGFYSYTLINFFQFSKFLALFAIVGFLIPLKLYRKWFHFGKYEMIIFNVLGVAPFLTGFFLLLNFTFISETFTHEYRIESIYFEGDQDFKAMGVVLENNFFSQERKIVELTDIPPNEVVGKKFLKLTISKGLFGFDVIKEKILIR